MKRKWLYFLLQIMTSIIFMTGISFAGLQPITLEFRNTNLAEAIRTLAKLVNINVLVSPAIHGVTTMNLLNADPNAAFNLLLMTNGLAKWRMGNIWFIGEREQLIKLKQDELKWQNAASEVAEMQSEVWQVRYGKADEIARVLQDEHTAMLSKRGHLRVDARTNVICIQDTEESLRNARRLLQQLDRPVRQIAISARLASVDNDFERELGIRFTVNNPTLINTETKNNSASEEIGRYSIAVATLADGSLLDVKLAALENAGHANLISSPSLFTANLEPAAIEAGEEIPYQEVSESGGTAVVFKKAVLGLKVTPQILPGNKVLLKLQINQDRPSSRLIQGVPAISTRQIMTNVLVETGQTIVLGGIYETNEENVEQRVPFLSKVPLVGWLFKQHNTRTNKRELLIFVTPTIIVEDHEYWTNKHISNWPDGRWKD